MRNLEFIVALLLVIGGLNWGLVGLFDFDLVGYLFGNYPLVRKGTYLLIGLCALYQLFLWRPLQCCRK